MCLFHHFCLHRYHCFIPPHPGYMLGKNIRKICGTCTLIIFPLFLFFLIRRKLSLLRMSCKGGGAFCQRECFQEVRESAILKLMLSVTPTAPDAALPLLFCVSAISPSGRLPPSSPLPSFQSPSPPLPSPVLVILIQFSSFLKSCNDQTLICIPVLLLILLRQLFFLLILFPIVFVFVHVTTREYCPLIFVFYWCCYLYGRRPMLARGNIKLRQKGGEREVIRYSGR